MLDQAQRQRLNDDRRRLFGQNDGPIAFICECADSACTATVPLAAAEYDARRLEQIVAPLHTVGSADLSGSSALGLTGFQQLVESSAKRVISRRGVGKRHRDRQTALNPAVEVDHVRVHVVQDRS